MAPTFDEIRAKIKRRREQLEFSKLPEKEKARRRAIGEDPYEPDMIRARKRELELERRKKEYDSLPVETRKAFEAVGWSPYQAGRITRRSGARVNLK